MRLARGDRLFYVVGRRRDSKSDNPAVVWARYSEMAFIIPAAVVVGLLLGKLLDYWLHTHWLFLVGIIFGAVVGFVQMIRMVTRTKD
ncbi:MAG TPA: AtpZ/AtpI family protein [Terriglobales bacterium]